MPYRRRFVKPLLLTAALAGGLWLVSALAFTVSALRLDTVEPAEAGCVAVFTGRHERVMAAIERFANAAVPHMLITGATEGTNREERDQMVARAPGYFDCCAEFEWESQNTLENGRVSAAWAQGLGCARVTIVTDDYHLARALGATRAADGGLVVQGHAISHVRAGVPDLRESARLLVLEFHKFLAMQIVGRR